MTVGIIGLGYVGLPLAVAFGGVGKTIGFDRDERKVARLRERKDVTGEVSAAEFGAARQLQCTADPAPCVKQFPDHRSATPSGCGTPTDSFAFY